MLVLREYHTALGVLVDKFEGTVERFVGDAPRENPPPPSVRRSPLFGCIYYRLQPTQILPAPAIRRPNK